MADISKCTGNVESVVNGINGEFRTRKECPLKSECKRWLDKSNGINQSYIAALYDFNSKKCPLHYPKVK